MIRTQPHDEFVPVDKWAGRAAAGSVNRLVQGPTEHVFRGIGVFRERQLTTVERPKKLPASRTHHTVCTSRRYGNRSSRLKGSLPLQREHSLSWVVAAAFDEMD